MNYELTQRFFFEAAHTLDREVGAEGSRRIHGHTYHAELAVAGSPDPVTGMVVDLGHLRALIERVRERLDHRMLNDVEGLGAPTLENLCAYLWRQFAAEGCVPRRVVVRREAMGDACCLTDGGLSTGA
jgi:6-pyruvoyltetrahydropterin/6-carboxytetrahydropterin synthase